MVMDNQNTAFSSNKLFVAQFTRFGITLHRNIQFTDDFIE